MVAGTRFPTACQPVKRVLLTLGHLCVLMGIGNAWALTTEGDYRQATPIATLKSFRAAHVILQKHDYSCGAASLATLLTEQLADPISEKEVIQQVLSTLPPGEVVEKEKNGLTLLDLQHVAEIRGHRSVGVRLPLDQLAKIDQAVIVYMQVKGSPHFSVLKGIRNGLAFLAIRLRETYVCRSRSLRSAGSPLKRKASESALPSSWSAQMK